MKLRNKNTGNIVRVEFLNNYQTDDGTEIGFRDCNENFVYSYNSLSELNADWEDYTPKEPLIKDEKIRKAIRAWAEANYISKVSYENGRFEGMFDGIEFCVNRLGIEFGKYTIAELCGEEE